MKFQFISLASVLLVASPHILAAPTAVPNTPDEFYYEFIGTPVPTDTKVDYDSASNIYKMSGKGGDIGGVADYLGTTDNFLYLYRDLRWDGELTVKISNFSAPKDWATVGIMVRQDASPSSSNNYFFMRPQFGSGGSYRYFSGDVAKTTWQYAPPKPSTDVTEDHKRTSEYRARYLHPLQGKWLRAVREGNWVTTYSSDDGNCWNLRTKQSFSFSGAALIGVALSTNGSLTPATANVSNVKYVDYQNGPAPDVNANCQRAQLDGDLTPPSSFLPPVSGWAITSINPDTAPELRTCISAQNPFRYTKSVDSPMCPLDLGATTNYASTKLGGIGKAGCIPNNCTDEINHQYPYVDLNEGAGYAWSMNDEFGGLAQIFLKLGAGASTTTSQIRKMSLFVNGVNYGPLSADSATANRTNGGKEFGPFMARLTAGSNTIELRDDQGTTEFDVYSMRIEKGPVPIPAWMKSGFNTTGWTTNTNAVVTASGVNNQPIWLRAEFDLAPGQKNDLVFYGSWTNSVSIYINGRLATNTFRSQLVSMNTMNKNVERKHYLGMNSDARTALITGRNVIAVRVECIDEKDSNSKIEKIYTSCNENAETEFGLAFNSKLANLPETAEGQVLKLTDAKTVNIFKQYTKEQGSIGGAFSDFKNFALTNKSWIGWADKKLTVPMGKDPSGRVIGEPVIRLASVDKRVTDAVAVYLIQKGILVPEEKIFAPGGKLNGIQPFGGWGANVLDITVEQLRAHTSGLNDYALDSQGSYDKLAFDFGITAKDLKTVHLVRYWAGLPTQFKPGEKEKYSNNGMALLRYICQIASGKTFNEILKEMDIADNGIEDGGISVDREDYSLRVAGGQPGYLIIDRETRSKWVELDEYLALAAKPSALVKFFINYAPQYIRQTDGTYKKGTDGQSGASDGVRGFGGGNPYNGDGLAAFWNSDLAGSKRFDDLLSIRNNGIDTLGRCNPAKVAPFQDVRFLNANMTGNESFLGVDLGVVATLKVSLFSSSAIVKWQYEAEQGSPGVYRIKNVQERTKADNTKEIVNSYLQIASSTLPDVKAGGFPADKRFANWRPVLNKSGSWVFENVMKPGFYLYIENGAIKVGSLSNPALSQDLKFQWLPCT